MLLLDLADVHITLPRFGIVDRGDAHDGAESVLKIVMSWLSVNSSIADIENIW